MKHAARFATATVFLAVGMSFWQFAHADIEATTPDGRRVLLRENGTWAYIETRQKETTPATTKDREGAKVASAKEGGGKEAKADKKDGELLLLIDGRIEGGNACRFGLQLVNKLPYEVTSLVLHFSAFRSDGVLYATETPGSGFGALKPGNSQRRELEFRGIGCKDIARLQVSGGDRCTMGELHRWSDIDEVRGQCLARVKVVESKLLRFDK